MVDIVLNVILFNPFNARGLYIHPFEMQLKNQRRRTSCSMLRGQVHIKLNIAMQVPETYIYALFCVLSTTTMAFEN